MFKEWSFEFKKGKYQLDLIVDTEYWGIGISTLWGKIIVIQIYLLFASIVFYKWRGANDNDETI